MSQRSCLGAHTAPGCHYPPYVSINREENGAVSITVRSPVSPTGECGVTACMEMSESRFRELCLDAQGALTQEDLCPN